MSIGLYSDIPLLIEVRDVKLARIIIRPDGIVKVVVPKGYDVEQLLSKKKDWILQQLSQIEQYQKIALSENFYLFGKPIGLEFKYHNGQGSRLTILNNKAILFVPGFKKGQEIKVLEKELRKLLRNKLNESLAKYSRLLGVRYNRVSIKKHKSKWGSCSHKNNLNFNLALLSLPEDTMRYAVLHELVHLIEKKHTKKFWLIVGSLIPDYKKHEKILEEHWIIVWNNEIWRQLLNLPLPSVSRV
ncbi:YgjP-like metallopeptidase domain-containing protein [Thermococcus sp.]|uniref:M48 family metallopeptidase n=1 Tax=Thermococcus sp. TaxID=35749 RepID=UPI002616A978|nr:YgjP-like metallopeptidase domain-containing protein [Thermococcus sp.]